MWRLRHHHPSNKVLLKRESNGIQTRARRDTSHRTRHTCITSKPLAREQQLQSRTAAPREGKGTRETGPAGRTTWVDGEDNHSTENGTFPKYRRSLLSVKRTTKISGKEVRFCDDKGFLGSGQSACCFHLGSSRLYAMKTTRTINVDEAEEIRRRVVYAGHGSSARSARSSSLHRKSRLGGEQQPESMEEQHEEGEQVEMVQPVSRTLRQQADHLSGTQPTVTVGSTRSRSNRAQKGGTALCSIVSDAVGPS